jgi:hypothetical protein
MFEEIELMIDQSTVELSHAIGMTEEIRARVRQIIAGRIGNVVRDLDFLHLPAIDGVRTEIAWDR